MRLRLIALLCALASTCVLKAQIHFSDSLQISLLTVADGRDAYECFGHTGLRILDLKEGTDVVFHYGVYNYREPNFIWHFVEGKCNYMMGGCYTDAFIDEHRMRQLDVTEQVLSLGPAQSSALTRALLINFRPENRNYRYNFFFDNCATRPFDMLNRWAPIEYDTTWTEPKTLRDMVQEKSGLGNWLDFGISLAVAGRADKQTSFREQMFLPSYLSQAVAHASLDGKPLVARTEVHKFGVQPTDPDADACPLSPLVAGLILLAVALLISLMELQRCKSGLPVGRAIPIASRTLDTIWLLASGVTGCIIWFLNFFSEHPAVDNNLNCLWLLPTNILFIAFIWLKKAKKVRRIYFFIIFAAVIAYIISVCACKQYVHPAFIPLLLTIALRALCGVARRE